MYNVLQLQKEIDKHKHVWVFSRYYQLPPTAQNVYVKLICVFKLPSGVPLCGFIDSWLWFKISEHLKSNKHGYNEITTITIFTT